MEVFYKYLKNNNLIKYIYICNDHKIKEQLLVVC